MKLYLEADEFMKMLQEELPKGFFYGYTILNVETEGYPIRGFRVTFEKIVEKEKVA